MLSNPVFRLMVNVIARLVLVDRDAVIVKTTTGDIPRIAATVSIALADR